MPFVLLLIMIVLLAPRAGTAQADAPESITVSAAPVPLDAGDASRTVVGGLRYLGGLHLTSPDPRFGGLSGLRWHDGQLFAVSDRGDFFHLSLQERDERLVGVREVRVRRLTRPDGRPLGDKAESDAEALELQANRPACPPPSGPCPGAAAVVAFEGSNALWRYRLVDGLPEGVPEELDWSAGWRRGLPHNSGVEAMAEGWLLAEGLREPDGRASGRLTEWSTTAVFCSHPPSPGPASGAPEARETPMHLPLSGGFVPTDADAAELVPGGPVFVLQRRYTPPAALAARIVRLRPAGASGPGERAVAALETLAELVPPLTVDNFEGLAYRGEQGHYLYIVSDDNFSPLQRTLLLKFEVVP